MRIALVIVTCLSLLVATVASVGWYSEVYRPWTKLPALSEAEIDQRWAELERKVSRDLPKQAGPGPLLDASRLGHENRATLEAVLSKTYADGAPPGKLDLAGLEPALQRALGALVAWHAQRAGLGIGRCQAPEYSAVALLDLGKLALAAAGAPDDPLVESTLALAAALRTKDDFLSAMVGWALLRPAVDVFEVRDWRLPDPLKRYSPRPEEVFPSLVRYEACSLERLARRLSESPEFDWDDAPLTPASIPPAFVPIQARRELAAYKLFKLEHYTAAAEAAGDLGCLSIALRKPPPDRLPRSVLVRSAIMPYDSYVAKLQSDLDRWNGLVASSQR